MAWHQTDDKPLYEAMMAVYRSDAINVLVQEKRNSSANTLELRLSCTNPSVWPRHKKAQGHMTSSNGNIYRVTGHLCGEFIGSGEFPAQRPVTRSFDVFFDLRPNKRLSKQSWGWWFETPSRSLWRHCNYSMSYIHVQHRLNRANTSHYITHTVR